MSSYGDLQCLYNRIRDQNCNSSEVISLSYSFVDYLDKFLLDSVISGQVDTNEEFLMTKVFPTFIENLIGFKDYEKEDIPSVLNVASQLVQFTAFSFRKNTKIPNNALTPIFIPKNGFFKNYESTQKQFVQELYSRGIFSQFLLNLAEIFDESRIFYYILVDMASFLDTPQLCELVQQIELIFRKQLQIFMEYNSRNDNNDLICFIVYTTVLLITTIAKSPVIVQDLLDFFEFSICSTKSDLQSLSITVFSEIVSDVSYYYTDRYIKWLSEGKFLKQMMEGNLSISSYKMINKVIKYIFYKFEPSLEFLITNFSMIPNRCALYHQYLLNIFCGIVQSSLENVQTNFLEWLFDFEDSIKFSLLSLMYNIYYAKNKESFNIIHNYLFNQIKNSYSDTNLIMCFKSIIDANKSQALVYYILNQLLDIGKDHFSLTAIVIYDSIFDMYTLNDSIVYSVAIQIIEFIDDGLLSQAVCNLFENMILKGYRFLDSDFFNQLILRSNSGPWDFLVSVFRNPLLLLVKGGCEFLFEYLDHFDYSQAKSQMIEFLILFIISYGVSTHDISMNLYYGPNCKYEVKRFPLKGLSYLYLCIIKPLDNDTSDCAIRHMCTFFNSIPNFDSSVHFLDFHREIICQNLGDNDREQILNLKFLYKLCKIFEFRCGIEDIGIHTHKEFLKKNRIIVSIIDDQQKKLMDLKVSPNIQLGELLIKIKYKLKQDSSVCFINFNNADYSSELVKLGITKNCSIPVSFTKSSEIESPTSSISDLLENMQYPEKAFGYLNNHSNSGMQYYVYGLLSIFRPIERLRNSIKNFESAKLVLSSVETEYMQAYVFRITNDCLKDPELPKLYDQHGISDYILDLFIKGEVFDISLYEALKMLLKLNPSKLKDNIGTIIAILMKTLSFSGNHDLNKYCGEYLIHISMKFPIIYEEQFLLQTPTLNFILLGSESKCHELMDVVLCALPNKSKGFDLLSQTKSPTKSIIILSILLEKTAPEEWNDKQIISILENYISNQCDSEYLRFIKIVQSFFSVKKGTVASNYRLISSILHMLIKSHKEDFRDEIITMIIAIISDKEIQIHIVEELIMFLGKSDFPFNYIQISQNKICDGVTGLMNLGNTCYMNSTLQVLYSIPIFRNSFLECVIDNPDSTMYPLALLFYKMSKTHRPYTSPTDFLTKFFETGSISQPHSQQDAIEFYTILINKLLSENLSTIYGLFQSKIQEKIIEGQSNIITTTTQLYHSISLRISGFKNLEASLADYFKFEQIPNYFSESLNRNTTVKKISKIVESPVVLVLQLSRFSYNFERGRREKINTRFEFPDDLDIGPYIEEHDSPSKYTLLGVIAHDGEPENGHFVSIFQKQHEWYISSDYQVEKIIDDRKRKDICYGLNNENLNAYILFYIEEGIDSQINRSSPPIPDDIQKAVNDDNDMYHTINNVFSKSFYNMISHINNPKLNMVYLLSVFLRNTNYEQYYDFFGIVTKQISDSKNALFSVEYFLSQFELITRILTHCSDKIKVNKFINIIQQVFMNAQLPNSKRFLLLLMDLLRNKVENSRLLSYLYQMVYVFLKIPGILSKFPNGQIVDIIQNSIKQGFQNVDLQVFVSVLDFSFAFKSLALFRYYNSDCLISIMQLVFQSFRHSSDYMYLLENYSTESIEDLYHRLFENNDMNAVLKLRNVMFSITYLEHYKLLFEKFIFVFIHTTTYDDEFKLKAIYTCSVIAKKYHYSFLNMLFLSNSAGLFDFLLSNDHSIRELAEHTISSFFLGDDACESDALFNEIYQDECVLAFSEPLQKKEFHTNISEKSSLTSFILDIQRFIDQVINNISLMDLRNFKSVFRIIGIVFSQTEINWVNETGFIDTFFRLMSLFDLGNCKYNAILAWVNIQPENYSLLSQNHLDSFIRLAFNEEPCYNQSNFDVFLVSLKFLLNNPRYHISRNVFLDERCVKLSIINFLQLSESDHLKKFKSILEYGSKEGISMFLDFLNESQACCLPIYHILMLNINPDKNTFSLRFLAQLSIQLSLTNESHSMLVLIFSTLREYIQQNRNSFDEKDLFLSEYLHKNIPEQVFQQVSSLFNEFLSVIPSKRQSIIEYFLESNSLTYSDIVLYIKCIVDHEQPESNLLVFENVLNTFSNIFDPNRKVYNKIILKQVFRIVSSEKMKNNFAIKSFLIGIDPMKLNEEDKALYDHLLANMKKIK